MPPPLVAPTEPVISIQAAASDRHSAPKPARSAPLPPSGQLILAADKRNPLLSVYHDGERQQLRVYYGFEIIEIVPYDTQAGSYKLLLVAISKVSGNTQDILPKWLAALWLGAPASRAPPGLVAAGAVTSTIALRFCDGTPTPRRTRRESAP